MARQELRKRVECVWIEQGVTSMIKEEDNNAGVHERTDEVDPRLVNTRLSDTRKKILVLKTLKITSKARNNVGNR